jgi:hypothetical protein
MQGTFSVNQRTFGVIQGTFGVIQGTSGVVKRTLGVVQGTCDVIEGTFGVHRPKTKRQDVELVHELSYAPPKVHVARRSSEALEPPAEAFIHPPEELTRDDSLDAEETDLGETLRDLQVDGAGQLEAQ